MTFTAGALGGVLVRNQSPSVVNVSAAIIGLTPIIGDASAKGIKYADNIADATKRFSKEKEALVDMAKSDKRTGITTVDMQAYKDLNKGLPDPFDSKQVRGPEAHLSGAPTSQEPHGHVGPVNHIPIKDELR